MDKRLGGRGSLLYYYPRLLYEFLFFGFIGLVVETLYVVFMTGKWTIRGSLGYGLPIIHIYGFGCLIVVYLLGRYKERPILFYLLSTAFMTGVELTGSYMEEFYTGHRSWNYSNKPFNFQGRVCLSSSLAWGTMAFLTVFVFHPEIRRILRRIPRKVLVLSSVFLTGYILVVTWLKYMV